MTDARSIHQPADAGPSKHPDRFLTASQLSLSELEQVQLLATEFERERERNPEADLAAQVLEADVELRPLLLQQLLEIEIKSRREAGAPPPTLVQLEVQYPALETLLPAAYHRLDASFRTPDVVGGYRLQQILGAGTQGFVASAYLMALPDTKAVVKYAKHGQSPDRIHQEARFLSMLDGRGVPSVINKGTAADGTAFLVMEKLQGHNLDDFLNKEGQTSRGLLWSAKIVHQLAVMLGEIHAAHILHRDLKPSNLFVEAGDRLRIIDFGLAVDMNSGFGPRPPVSEFHGTPAYQAPEQLAADPTIDGRLSDIFAVGRILLACLAGSDAVIAAYYREHPEAEAVPDMLAPSVKIASRQLARIQAKTAHPDPALRYQATSELAHDLRRYLRKQQALRWLQWGGLSGAAALIVLAVVMMFLPVASPPTVKEDLSVEGVSLSPEFRENLNRENLMLALSRGDASTLEDYERRQAPVDLYESALDATRIGESRSVAQHFFASCKERPQALAWLERALAEGMDPNLVVPSTANPRESLLGVAWTENNVAAMHLLLKSGATPHVYQQLTGWKWDAPRMLFPLDNLMRWKGFTPQEIASLTPAFLAAGAVLPEPIPDLKTSKENGQTEIIERQLAALRERYELDVMPNPDLWVRRESAFAERATQRTGTDWNRLLREIPLLLTAHEDETIGLAFGTLGPIEIQYLLGIMEGKAYFQASSSVLHRPTYLIAETDERGQIWRLYIYGSSSLRAMGAPRIDPADKFPDTAWDSWYWRYYDGKYDTDTRIMEFQCTNYQAKYVGLHSPEEVEANRLRQQQKKAEERKQQEKLAEEARQEEKKALEEWQQEKKAKELRRQEQKAEELRQRQQKADERSQQKKKALEKKR